jgi:hypothetical protein
MICGKPSVLRPILLANVHWYNIQLPFSGGSESLVDIRKDFFTFFVFQYHMGKLFSAQLLLNIFLRFYSIQLEILESSQSSPPQENSSGSVERHRECHWTHVNLMSFLKRCWNILWYLYNYITSWFIGKDFFPSWGILRDAWCIRWKDTFSAEKSYLFGP